MEHVMKIILSKMTIEELRATVMVWGTLYPADALRALDDQIDKRKTSFDGELVNILQTEGWISAVRYYRDHEGVSLRAAIDYVDSLKPPKGYKCSGLD